MKVTVEFGGGLETLFENIKSRSLELSSEINDMKDLLQILSIDCTKKELFLKESTIRPGILCLINDADWELEGTLEYILQEGDVLTFISTLHGG